MLKASNIEPDVELRNFLQDSISVVGPNQTTSYVTVYRDGERPTNGAPDDFIEVAINGGVDVLGSDIEYAEGSIMLILYNRLNDDGSIKHNRIKKILTQFDEVIDKLTTDHYFYKIDINNYIMPPTQDLQSGYSSMILNVLWHTALTSIR